MRDVNEGSYRYWEHPLERFKKGQFPAPGQTSKSGSQGRLAKRNPPWRSDTIYASATWCRAPTLTLSAN